MKVAVVGLGYVGAVTAACVACDGYDVWRVDVDAVKVDEICAGRSLVAEPGLEALVTQAVTGGTLPATTSCRDALDGANACWYAPGRHRRHAAAQTSPTCGAPWTISLRRRA